MFLHLMSKHLHVQYQIMAMSQHPFHFLSASLSISWGGLSATGTSLMENLEKHLKRSLIKSFVPKYRRPWLCSCEYPVQTIQLNNKTVTWWQVDALLPVCKVKIHHKHLLPWFDAECITFQHCARNYETKFRWTKNPDGCHQGHAEVFSWQRKELLRVSNFHTPLVDYRKHSIIA